MKTVYRAAATVNIEKQMCVASINKHTHTHMNREEKGGNRKGSRGFYYKTLWLHSMADAIITPPFFPLLFLTYKSTAFRCRMCCILQIIWFNTGSILQFYSPTDANTFITLYTCAHLHAFYSKKCQRKKPNGCENENMVVYAHYFSISL